MKLEDIAKIDEDGQAVCLECGEKKSTKNILLHWKAKHTAEGKEKGERARAAAAIASRTLVACPNCNQMFAKSTLRLHILGEERAENKKKSIFSNKCERCNEKIKEVYGTGRFCSQKCARSSATALNREAISKKTSDTVKKKFSHIYEDTTKECLHCNEKFTVSYKRKNKKFCDISCATKYKFNEKNPQYEENMRKARLAGIASSQLQRETRRSKNEIYFAQLCTDKFANVLCNEPMFDGWDADVIIPDLKIAVMWNGPWHRRKITKKHSVKQVQTRDKIKVDKIRAAGYNEYVIDDDGKFDKKFVEEQFEKLLKFLRKSSL